MRLQMAFTLSYIEPHINTKSHREIVSRDECRAMTKISIEKLREGLVSLEERM